MSAIVKSKAVILRKTNYGDSSYILSVFSEDQGKYSVIVKGARSGKNKKASVTDVLNLVELVIYKKENRDMQFVSQADLLNGYSTIKSNLDIMKYALAVSELIYQLIMENEPHGKLFRGLLKIFDLISNVNSNPKLLFAKFILFFIEEMGYKLNLKECASCNKVLQGENLLSFNFEQGFICGSCSDEKVGINFFSKELFNLIACLSTKKSEIKYSDKLLDTVISFFENYLKYHVPEFKGLQTLKIF